MRERVEEVRKVENPGFDGTPTQITRTKIVDDHEPQQTLVPATERYSIAARIIWFIAGAIIILLAFRFTLVLLGANPANAFANFVYTVSHPFVAPFFGLFSYNLRYGVSRVEIFTLVAMGVYAVIAFGLARLVTISRRTDRRSTV